MKKVLAVLLSITLLMSFSLASFALNVENEDVSDYSSSNNEVFDAAVSSASPLIFADFDLGSIGEMFSGFDISSIMGLLGGFDIIGTLSGLLGGTGAYESITGFFTDFDFNSLFGGFDILGMIGDFVSGIFGGGGGGGGSTTEPTTEDPWGDTTEDPWGDTTEDPWGTDPNYEIPQTGNGGEMGISIAVGMTMVAAAAYVLTKKNRK